MKNDDKSLGTIIGLVCSLWSMQLLFQTFILFEGFRKIWEMSGEIVAYFNIRDSEEIVKNALFLTLLTSGTFLVSLPFSMLEIHSRPPSETNKQITVTSILLDHCVAQTLLFPFVCLFIIAFKLGGNKTMLWVFGFAEFQLLNELLLETEPMELLENGDLRTGIIEVTNKHNFPLQHVFVSLRTRDQKLVTLRGFPKVKNIVLSKQLVGVHSSTGESFLTNEEINALVARELSHWNRSHFFVNFLVDQVRFQLPIPNSSKRSMPKNRTM